LTKRQSIRAAGQFAGHWFEIRDHLIRENPPHEDVTEDGLSSKKCFYRFRNHWVGQAE
jgi:hypothetical protein